jgi:hypothetical protein
VKPNYREQGDIGEAIAISYFVRRGWKVSLPLSGYRYDLVVDDGQKLYLVQVKTAFVRNRTSKGYDVHLKTCGGNRTGKDRVKYLDRRLDFVFVVTADDSLYLIPRNALGDNQGKMNVGNTKWNEFKVG